MAGVQRGVFALVGPFKLLSLVKSPSHPDGAAHAASVRPLTWVIDSRSADDKRTFEGSARARTAKKTRTTIQLWIGSGRSPYVSVVQPADLAQLRHLPELRWLNGARNRCVLFE